MRAILLFFLSFIINICNVNSQTLSITDISEIRPLKRGTANNVTLTGGNESSPLILELLKGNDNEIYGKWEKPINQGKVEIKLPLKIKPSSDYYLRIRDSQNKILTTSDPFKIRRKIPLGIKLGGIAVVAIPVVVLIAINNGEEGPPDIPNPLYPEQ